MKFLYLKIRFIHFFDPKSPKGHFTLSPYPAFKA